MKRTLLFIATCAVGLATSAQVILINENFDSYTVGSAMVANDGANWAVWPGGADQVVSSDQSSSPSNSMHCLATAAGGGPGDLLLLLGDKTTGTYTLSWNMYIATGGGGYFNIQHAESVTTPSFAAEVIFAGGTVTCTAAGIDSTSTYPESDWFNVTIAVDFGTGFATLIVAGDMVHLWPFATITTGAVGPSQLGSIDFFSYADGVAIGDFFVDDILYTDFTGVGVEEEAAQALNTFPNPTEGSITIEWAGASSSALVEVLDVTGRVVVAPRTAQRMGAVSRSQVDLGDVPDGVYFVRLRDGVREEVRRVTKH